MGSTRRPPRTHPTRPLTSQRLNPVRLLTRCRTCLRSRAELQISCHLLRAGRVAQQLMEHVEAVVPRRVARAALPCMQGWSLRRSGPFGFAGGQLMEHCLGPLGRAGRVGRSVGSHGRFVVFAQKLNERSAQRRVGSHALAHLCLVVERQQLQHRRRQPRVGRRRGPRGRVRVAAEPGYHSPRHSTASPGSGACAGGAVSASGAKHRHRRRRCGKVACLGAPSGGRPTRLGTVRRAVLGGSYHARRARFVPQPGPVPAAGGRSDRRSAASPRAQRDQRNTDLQLAQTECCRASG